MWHEDWKLIQAGSHVWLFDLAADHPNVVSELQDALDAWESELAPPAWPSRSGGEAMVDGVSYEIQI